VDNVAAYRLDRLNRGWCIIVRLILHLHASLHAAARINSRGMAPLTTTSLPSFRSLAAKVAKNVTERYIRRNMPTMRRAVERLEDALWSAESADETALNERKGPT
jgi:hypothetical protein